MKVQVKIDSTELKLGDEFRKFENGATAYLYAGQMAHERYFRTSPTSEHLHLLYQDRVWVEREISPRYIVELRTPQKGDRYFTSGGQLQVAIETHEPTSRQAVIIEEVHP